MNDLNQLILRWADDKGILANVIAKRTGEMIDGLFVKSK